MDTQYDTMIMTYGSYHKDQKFPMAGITAKHKFKKGSIGYAKIYKNVWVSILS